jgi:CheY-like chemotaxis protein
MDGDISVSSTPGRGSLFRVDVALPRSASQEVVSPAPHRVVRGLAPGQSRSILVADDNEDARLLLGELLRSVGFEVRTAGDGQEALDAWRAAAPHLVFMDIDMPILDGIAAARAIRAEESAAGLSRTPVVALSASAFEHERAAVLVAGCDAFLAKPFREDDLFGLLGGLLGVTFVYDEQEGTAPPSPSEAAAVNRERLGRLPEAWRARFRDALGRADAEEALRLVSEVEGEDPALIRAIAARLKAYRMDELEELLEPRPEAP